MHIELNTSKPFFFFSFADIRLARDLPSQYGDENLVQ